MAILHLRKIYYIIRYVSLYWISVLITKRNLKQMRNTYTSKPTSKRSTHIICRIFFGIFSSSNNKILLDAQIKEYHTKLSTKPNKYDDSHNNTNILPTAPHLPNLHHNHPLSIISRNFRKLSITNPPNLRPNNIQSPIQHIMDKLDHSIDQTPTLPISKIQSPLSLFLFLRHLIHLKLTHHQA